MSEQDQAELRLQYARLKQDHADFDAAINAMIATGCDPIQIQRMKKKKLQLKRRDHHGQPVRLGDHAPCRRDARRARRRPRGAHRLGAPHARTGCSFARGAKAKGFKVIIAGAGGAAHLPGMTAAMTPLPVFGVPVESKALSGQDSLLSIVQMPAGIPVGTLAIGKAGAVNAALLAAAVLALGDDALADRLDAWRKGADATRSPSAPWTSLTL
jgi:phosphoribosylaminoimidazole carboxylase PurE protein